MKTMVIIPMAVYSSLIGKCEIQSAEYTMLRNGIIQRQEDREEVHFLCDEEQAGKLVDFVTRAGPEHLATLRQVELPTDA